ncbi:hypothetical protein [Vibrio ordalii]|nr:hypothetical protein [Vibrio ordalii]
MNHFVFVHTVRVSIDLTAPKPSLTTDACRMFDDKKAPIFS